MHAPGLRPTRPIRRKVAVVQQKATHLRLCSGLDGQPSCVYACPHDAAHSRAAKRC